MRAIVFLCTLGLSLTILADPSPAPVCSLEGLQNLCASLPSADQPWIQLPNGRWMQNPKYGKVGEGGKFDPTVPPPPITAAQTANSRRTIQSQFEVVKGQFLAEIRSGSTDDNLSSAQKQWLGIIKNIKLEITPKKCSGGKDLSGGQFDAVRQTLEVCENAGLESMGRLTWLLAHEMGHSVDGCNIQADYYRRNGHLPLPSGTRLSQATNMLYEKGLETSSNFAQIGRAHV
jgi:hypothetical protein